jgi:radical SAM superfamily enzyme YgiQ (UPF0313 family)
MSTKGTEFTTLLVESPNGMALDVPFGTLPALTASLRTNGHQTIQRDLNTEFLFLLFEVDVHGILTESLQKKAHELDKFCGSGKQSPLKLIRRRLLRFTGAGPLLRRIYFRFHPPELNEEDSLLAVLFQIRQILRQLDRGREIYAHLQEVFREFRESGEISLEDRIKANRFYRLALNGMNLLATPIQRKREYLERINHSDNLYRKLYLHFLDSVEWDHIRLAGITTTEQNKLAALTLAAVIREKHPEVHIVLGGMLFHETDLEDPNDIQDLETIAGTLANSIVMYEGDTAIYKLAGALKEGKDLSEVPNLVWKKANGSLHIPSRFIFEDTRTLPPYDFEGLPVKYYLGLPVEISRGCYWGKCAFCRYCTMHFRKDSFDKGHYYRSFPLGHVLSQIKTYQSSYGVRNIELVCLDISPPEADKLCDAIFDQGIEVQWNARIRLDKTFKPELFHKMARAGAVQFTFYPETLSKKVALLHDKGYDIDHIKELIRYWQQHKSELPPLVVKIMAGFPGESMADFMESIHYVKHNGVPLQTVNLFGFVKGSATYYHPEKYGLTMERKRMNDRLFYHLKVNWPQTLRAERNKIARYILLKNKDLKKLSRGWTGKYEKFAEVGREG